MASDEVLPTNSQPTKHRTTPKQDSITSVPGYPNKLVIYQLDASPFWWVRYYVDKKVVRRSTKSTDKRKAFAFAKEFYDEINHKRRHGLAFGSQSKFELCAYDFMEAQATRVARGDLSQMLHQSDGYRLKNHILPFFQEYEIDHIDYFAMEKFHNVLAKLKLTSSTISSYFGLVRKILGYAVRKGFITSIPEFPKLKKEDKPRGWFPTKEYRKLWSAARRLRGQKFELRKSDDEQEGVYYCKAKTRTDGKLLRNIEMSEDIYQLIVFMTNSFIRPSDIKFIQHKHVEVIEGDDTYLRLSLPETKKHNKPIVTMEKAVEVYKRLKAFHAQRGMAKQNDFLFLPQHKERGYALDLLERQFGAVLNVTGLKYGPRDEVRTLYSLRHTCIMYRLLYGANIDILTIARNARTTPEMIDRFYASHLDGEMNIRMIQSRRTRTKTSPQ